MSDPIKTPISAGIIERVVKGVKYVVSGAEPDAWFSPSQPLPPFAQEAAVGRQFDYQTGYNLQQQPKIYEGVTFAQLRALADGLDILRLVIETRKDMLCKMRFSIQPTDEDKPQDERCSEIEAFFRFPDQEHSWEEWLRMILEDLFVCDAPALYPRFTYGQTLYGLEPMDGATIKRVIDGQGRTPMPPEVAYQQILKGVPAVDYSRDELIYKPRNLRTNKIYGYSPVEQILLTVNTALRRQVSQLQYYTDGDAVDRILSVPAEWNPDQVAQFREWWTSMLAGNTSQRRQTMFVPNGVTSVNTKEALLKDDFDEWLARVVCYSFSISPTPFVKQVNRATANTAKESAEEEGIQPIKQWIKSLIDYIIVKYFGYEDLCLMWEDMTTADPLMQAQIAQIYINSGIKTANEVREDLGLEAIEEPVGTLASTSVQSAGTEKLPKETSNTKEVKEPTLPTAKKMELNVKKSKRGIAPLNRQRQEVLKNRAGLSKVIKKALAKKAREYIDAISQVRFKTVKSIDDAKKAEELLLHALIDINWNDFADDVEPYLRAMALDGVKQAALQIQLDNIAGADVNLANERAEEYANARAAEMVGKKWINGELVDNPNAQWVISESTRDMIQADVATAIEEGWGNGKLADVLMENYAFSEERADAIARTETATADVAGNMEAYQEAQDNGVEVLKQWITANDDLVSEDCVLNGDSEPIGLDEAFPSGALEPPEHPNCRCDILPVLVDSEDDSEKLEKYSDDQERDENGRWTSGGGSNNTSQGLIGWTPTVSKELINHVQELTNQVAEAHNFDTSRINVSPEHRTIEVFAGIGVVDGVIQSFNNVFEVTGATYPSGTIDIFPASMQASQEWGTFNDAQKDEHIKEVVAHEIGHAIFDDVSKAYFAAIQLPAPFSPAVQSISNLMSTKGLFTRLEKEDGITAYSNDNWDYYHEGSGTKATAMHETFAEINAKAYIKSEGGKTQTSLANLKSIGVKSSWKLYYRTYMSAYKEMKTKP